MRLAQSSDKEGAETECNESEASTAAAGHAIIVGRYLIFETPESAHRILNSKPYKATDRGENQVRGKIRRRSRVHHRIIK